MGSTEAGDITSEELLMIAMAISESLLAHADWTLMEGCEAIGVGVSLSAAEIDKEILSLRHKVETEIARMRSWATLSSPPILDISVHRAETAAELDAVRREVSTWDQLSIEPSDGLRSQA